VGLDESRALYWLIRESDMLVNATSVGLSGGEKIKLNPNSLHPKLFVFDLVYRETALLKMAARRGLKHLDGVGMLVSQGRAFLRNIHWQATAIPRHAQRRRTSSKIRKIERNVILCGRRQGIPRLYPRGMTIENASLLNRWRIAR